MAVRVLVCALAIVIATAPEAAAGDRKVVVFPIAGVVENKPDLARRLTEALADARRTEGVTVEISPASLGDVLTLAGCAAIDTDCAPKLLAAAAAQEVATAQVQQDGATWIARITWVRKGQDIVTESKALRAGSNDGVVTEFLEFSKSVIGSVATEPAETDTVVDPPEQDVVVEPPDATQEPDTDSTPPTVIAPPESDGSGFDLGNAGTLAWTTTGAGVVLAGIGVALLGTASGRQDEIDAQPTGSVDDLDRLEELEDSAERLELFGNGLLVAGALTAAVGITLVIVGATSSESEPAVVVSPTPMAGGAGVTVTILGLP